MISAPNAAIWTVQARLGALTAVPSLYEVSARTGSSWERTLYPPKHQPYPIEDICSSYRLASHVSKPNQQTPSYIGLIILAAMEDIM